MTNGVSRVREDEEDVEDSIAEEMVKNPQQAAELACKYTKVGKECLERYPCRDGMRIIGSFDNLRNKFFWEGLVLEVDETVVC